MNEMAYDRQLVEKLAEEFVERYRAGERSSLDKYITAHPQHADEIRDLFPALVMIEELAPSEDGSSSAPPATPAAPLERVGDYRILREVGRGGMGIVYEAEQESLGRRVALKVLHLHAGQDPRLLTRFRRESRAAAQLHHTNIVPVFEVGQQNGVCYYAMQFIRGQALDEVFRELQHLRVDSASGATAQMPRSAETTTAALPDRSELSSVTSNYRRYCRNVARLGLQAAEALAYAHARGIVHRDIKPANLLLDITGVLWVSDFGLVTTQDPALTDTGDLVGTVRYMAPERFRGECDARADVYALGLTLYELLVLRPAFDGQDRLHLVDQIGHQEPARPRALDSRIPHDLETLLMKAIEKDLRRRYPSAEALAGDLRRFLADEPIQAQRIGPLERLGRWGRRNPLVAGLSAAVVLVALGGFLGVLGQWQAAAAHALEAQKNEREANKQRDDANALAEKLQHVLYISNMNLARHAWEAGGVEQARELLEQHRPKPGESDLRHFEWHYLYRLFHAELLTLKGHTERVTSVVFSPDGKHLAICAKVLNVRTGQEQLSLKGDDTTGVFFSPDGKRLASVGTEEMKMWDAQTGQELLTLKGASQSVAFSPDGKRLASVAPGAVKVWDVQTGQETLSLKASQSFVSFVAFSPDGHRLGALRQTAK